MSMEEIGRVVMKGVCRECGADYIKKKSWQEFCSDKCHDTYHNKKKREMKNDSQPENVR